MSGFTSAIAIQFERNGTIDSGSKINGGPVMTDKNHILDVAQTAQKRETYECCYVSKNRWGIYPARAVNDGIEFFLAYATTKEAAQEIVDAANAAQPPAAPVEVNQFETTPSGVIDWKMEAERANRLLAKAERPKCRLCGLEDGACICAHLPPAQPPAAPVETKRKTFPIPPGHEAVRDSEGRATGEVRPRSSAENGGEK